MDYEKLLNLIDTKHEHAYSLGIDQRNTNTGETNMNANTTATTEINALLNGRHSAAFRAAYLAINAYKSLVNSPFRTNGDTTTINAQKVTIRETLADVTDRAEINALRNYFHA